MSLRSLPVHKLPAYKTDKYSLPITDLVSTTSQFTNVV